MRESLERLGASEMPLARARRSRGRGHRAHVGRGRARGVVAALVLAAALGGPTRAAADERRASAWRPGTALRSLVRTPLHVTGDVAAGAGLVSAALVASLGDLVALADRNRLTRGGLSCGIHTLARGLSFGGTTLLETLSGHDVERWPEATATYVDSAPFYGRGDTALSGLAAFRVAVSDLALGPAIAGSHLVGASTLAERLEHRLRDDRWYYLGPPPLPESPREAHTDPAAPVEHATARAPSPRSALDAR